MESKLPDGVVIANKGEASKKLNLTDLFNIYCKETNHPLKMEDFVKSLDNSYAVVASYSKNSIFEGYLRVISDGLSFGFADQVFLADESSKECALAKLSIAMETLVRPPAFLRLTCSPVFADKIGLEQKSGFYVPPTADQVFNQFMMNLKIAQQQ